jgi:protease-4
MSNKYVVLNLTGLYRDTSPLIKSFFAHNRATEIFRFDIFLIAVEKIINNKKIKKVLIDSKMDFLSNTFSGLEAVRNQLERMVLAGKEVYYYSKDYNVQDVYLGSACSKRIMHPLGELKFLGIFHQFRFLKNLREKFDIDIDVIRRGKYKSAADFLRVDRIDEWNKEQFEAIFNTYFNEICDKVKESMNKSDEDIDKLLNGYKPDAKQALDDGWIDDIRTNVDMLDLWKGIEHLKEDRIVIKRLRYGKGKKIAILFFEGAIIDGKSRQDPLLGQALGSDTYLKYIQELKKDNSIQGVVFRVNSGGGSATASEDIVNEIYKLNNEKPVVVSMSEVAGSGGYWISTACDKLFAQNTTITGSIGVISALFYMKDFFNRYGITHSTIKKGKFADVGSTIRRMTDEDRKIIESFVDNIYQKFLEKVSKFRDMEKDDVHNIAQGRIWSGKDAKEIGIIDEVGDITQAVDYLKNKLQLERAKVEFYPKIKYSLLERILFNARVAQTSTGLSDIVNLLDYKSSFFFRSNAKPLAIMTEFIDFFR